MNTLKKYTFLLCLAAFTVSCTSVNPLTTSESGYTKKEKRKINRANRKLQKAIKIWPDIVQGKTVMVPVKYTFSEVSSTITKPEIGQIRTITIETGNTIQCIDLPIIVPIDDENIKGTITVDTFGQLSFDYTIKEKTISTEIPIQQNTINPVKVVTDHSIPWYIYLLIGALVLIIIGLLFKK